MNDTKQQNQKVRKHSKLKITLIAVVALLALLVILVLVAVPAYISSNSGRKTILAKINKSVEGDTSFAGLSMGWFDGVGIENFSYQDSIGRTKVKIKQIQTRPHYAALLTGNLSFGKTVVEQPQVTIDLRKKAPASADKNATEQKTKKSMRLPVSKIDLHIRDGDFRVTGDAGNSVHLADINSRLDLKGPDRDNRFAADMTISDSGKSTPLHAEGTINPKKISGSLTVEVNELDMASLAPLLDLAEVQIDPKGSLTTDIKTEFENGKLQSLNGTVTGTNVNITGPALKGDTFKTSKLNLDAGLTRQKELLNIEKLSLTTDWAQIDAAGKMPTALDSLSQFLQPDADYKLSCDVQADLSALANQMPNTLNIEPGTTVTSGKLTGRIARSVEAGKARIEADFSITDLAGRVEQKQIALSAPITAQALITSDQSQITLEKLQVDSSFAQVKCTGNQNLLAYEANADLQKLQSELGGFINLGEYKTTGLINSVGKITPEKDNFNINGSATIEQLQITDADGHTASEPRANVTMDLDVDKETKDVSVKSLVCKGTFGNVSVEDGLFPAGRAAKKLELPINAEVDLEKIRPFAMLSDFYPQKLLLWGTAVSELRISAGEKTFSLTTDSTRIKDFGYATPDTQKVSLGQVDAKLDIDSGPEKTTIKFDVISPDIKLKGDFISQTSRQQKTVTAKADADYDWKFVSTLLSAFMSDELKIEGRNNTNVEFTTTYPADKPEKLLANMSTKPITVAFDSAEYRGFEVTKPSQITVRLDKGVLDIPKFSLTLNDGMFTYAGQADFTQEKVLLKLSQPMQILQNVRLDKEISLKLLQYIFPIFNDAQRVNGLANFTCDILEIPLTGADKTDLAVDGTFSVKDLLLQSSIFDAVTGYFGKKGQYNKMEILPTHIIARDGIVTYDNMQLNAGNHPFNSVGRINLINKSIEGSMIITPYTTGRTINVGEENTAGRIKVPLTGTYNNPKPDFGGIIQQNIGNILRETIKDSDLDIGNLKDILKNR